MFFLGSAAASSAMDLISSLRDTISGRQKQGTGVTQSTSFDSSASSNSGASATQAGSLASPQSLTSSTMMNALFSVQEQNQASSSKNSLSSQLFSLIDANGDGSISKDEFEKVFAANGDTTKADSVFGNLDTNKDGSISPSELASALKARGHRHHKPDETSGTAGAADPTSGNNSGSTAKTVTNPDGSTTTTLTYSDGSTVSMTRPAAGSGDAPSNFLERMIARQAQTLGASTAGQSVAVTA